VEFEDKFDNYFNIPHSQISRNAKDARPRAQVVRTLIDLALFKLVAMPKLYDSGDESIYKRPQEKIAMQKHIYITFSGKLSSRMRKNLPQGRHVLRHKLRFLNRIISSLVLNVESQKTTTSLSSLSLQGNLFAAANEQKMSKFLRNRQQHKDPTSARVNGFL
jgi:hypothetical protein